MGEDIVPAKQNIQLDKCTLKLKLDHDFIFGYNILNSSVPGFILTFISFL